MSDDIVGKDGFCIIQPGIYGDEDAIVFCCEECRIVRECIFRIIACQHGIGTALVSEIEKHIKQVHPEPCTLEIYVNSRNAAADFYHQRGFAKVRERNIAFDNGFVLIQEVLQKNL